MCNSNAFVSVIIPTYNRRQKLFRAISSVMEQSFQDYEIIVIDNDSSDGTKEMVSDLANPKVRFLTIRNGGVIAKSRNAGLLTANGQIVAFLDSDDSWFPTKLEEAVEAHSKGSDVVYHDLAILYDNANISKKQTVGARALSKMPFSDLVTCGNCIPLSSVTCRADVLRGINYFSEKPELATVEDFDAWLRLAKCRSSFTYIDKTLGFYEKGSGNTSNLTRNLIGYKYLYERKFYKYFQKQHSPIWLRKEILKYNLWCLWKLQYFKLINNRFEGFFETSVFEKGN